MVTSKRTNSREHWYREKQTRELTAYCMILLRKNRELLKELLNNDFSPTKPCIWSNYGYYFQSVFFLLVGKHGYCPRPQLSRQMPRVGLKGVGICRLSIVTLGHAYPLLRLSVHHLLRNAHRKLLMKRNSFLPNYRPLF